MTAEELARWLPSAHAPSESEAHRTSSVVPHLVGEFHDRFWLPRGDVGDAAAASAASIAAVSPNPGQRSAAAHLYAVRTTQRVRSQVMHVVAHRAPRHPALQGDDFAADIEAAVGAAVHAELCRLFDEVSAMHGMMKAQLMAHGQFKAGRTQQAEDASQPASPTSPQPPFASAAPGEGEGEGEGEGRE